MTFAAFVCGLAIIFWGFSVRQNAHQPRSLTSAAILDHRFSFLRMLRERPD
jgi:hypothetical protein